MLFIIINYKKKYHKNKSSIIIKNKIEINNPIFLEYFLSIKNQSKMATIMGIISIDIYIINITIKLVILHVT